MTFQQKCTNLRDFYLLKRGPKNSGMGKPLTFWQCPKVSDFFQRIPSLMALYLYSSTGCSEMCVTAGGSPPPNSTRFNVRSQQTNRQTVLLQEHRRAKSEISRRRTRTTSQGRRLLPGETTTKIETNKDKKTTKQFLDQGFLKRTDVVVFWQVTKHMDGNLRRNSGLTFNVKHILIASYFMKKC